MHLFTRHARPLISFFVFHFLLTIPSLNGLIMCICVFCRLCGVHTLSPYIFCLWMPVCVHRKADVLFMHLACGRPFRVCPHFHLSPPLADKHPFGFSISNARRLRGNPNTTWWKFIKAFLWDMALVKQELAHHIFSAWVGLFVRHELMSLLDNSVFGHICPRFTGLCVQRSCCAVTFVTPPVKQLHMQPFPPFFVAVATFRHLIFIRQENKQPAGDFYAVCLSQNLHRHFLLGYLTCPLHWFVYFFHIEKVLKMCTNKQNALQNESVSGTKHTSPPLKWN